MNDRKSEVLWSGLGYLEAPRWYQDSLWASDFAHKKVYRFGQPGEAPQPVVEVPNVPSGLGWDRDGRLLVVSQEDSLLLRQDGAATALAADLSGDTFHANDMVVDCEGRAYVSQFGYDIFGGEEKKGTWLAMVGPDGSVVRTGADMVFPNGLAISADGATMVVAEGHSYRLTAFDIGEGGLLSNGRLFAQFDEGEILDGICIDVEGGVWVGCLGSGEFRRVLEGGEVTDRVIPGGPGRFTVAPALGGPDLRTLYLTVNDTDMERLATQGFDASDGYIEAVEVDVPGVPI